MFLKYFLLFNVKVYLMNDLKYLSALTIPFSAFISLFLKEGWLFLTPIYTFVFISLVESLIAVSVENYSEKTIEKRLKKPSI